MPHSRVGSRPVAGLGPQDLKLGPESCLGFWPGVWLSTMPQTHLLSHADLLEVLKRLQLPHALAYKVFCLSSSLVGCYLPFNPWLNHHLSQRACPGHSPPPHIGLGTVPLGSHGPRCLSFPHRLYLSGTLSLLGARFATAPGTQPVLWQCLLNE